MKLAKVTLVGVLLLGLPGLSAATDYPNATKRPRIGPPAATPWMDGRAVELIGNGSLETGDFPPWTFDSQGSGFWFVTDQSSGPISGLPLQPPSDGSWQAVVDQGGPGRHILYQEFTIPAGNTAELNLVYWYNNYAAFFNLGHLGFEGDPNQHMRIDIMDPNAPIDDTGPGVLENLFLTNPGDPTDLFPTPLNADLSAYQGQTIRLRIAEVDNQNFFTVGIDAVSVLADGPTPTEEATWGGIKAVYRQ
jgi:hypothetical protein